jgi:hypothetical protein
MRRRLALALLVATSSAEAAPMPGADSIRQVAEAAAPIQTVVCALWLARLGRLSRMLSAALRAGLCRGGAVLCGAVLDRGRLAAVLMPRLAAGAA